LINDEDGTIGLEMPKKLYAHGWLVMKDGKMSKSKGNVVYPEMLIERYGLDATKYFLLKQMSFGQDTMFTPEDFVEIFNADLCNDLGNLLNRTIGMINKYFQGTIPQIQKDNNEIDSNFEEFINNQLIKIEELLDTYHISNALSEIWAIISRTNKYIDETRPWELVKNEETEKLESSMYHLIENIRKVGIMLLPFMEETSQNLLRQIGVSQELQTWNSLSKYEELKDVKVIEKGEPLFMRKNMEEELEYLRN
jgi:methionyl-tRNA synthetase